MPDPTLDPHAALIDTMVMISAVDRDMSDVEMHIIGDIVNHLPVFQGYDAKRLTSDLKDCARRLSAEDGLEAARAFPHAAIVPLHCEGWEHYSESREEIRSAFAEAGLESRLRWLAPGRETILAIANVAGASGAARIAR